MATRDCGTPGMKTGGVVAPTGGIMALAGTYPGGGVVPLTGGGGSIAPAGRKTGGVTGCIALPAMNVGGGTPPTPPPGT